MDKKLLVVIAAVLLLAAAFFLLKDRFIKDSSTSQNSGNTLEELITSGQSYHCKYSTDDQDENILSAQSYIAQGGEKMYLEYTSQANGMTTQSYFVVNDGYGYTWQSNSTEGYKYALPQENPDDSDYISNDIKESNPVMEEAYGYEYECTPWVVDNSRFALPSGITFIDTEAMIKESMEQMSNQCDTCLQIPEGEAREQCLTALSCN